PYRLTPALRQARRADDPSSLIESDTNADGQVVTAGEIARHVPMLAYLGRQRLQGGAADGLRGGTAPLLARGRTLARTGRGPRRAGQGVEIEARFALRRGLRAGPRRRGRGFAARRGRLRPRLLGRGSGTRRGRPRGRRRRGAGRRRRGPGSGR